MNHDFVSGLAPLSNSGQSADWARGSIDEYRPQPYDAAKEDCICPPGALSSTTLCSFHVRENSSLDW